MLFKSYYRLHILKLKLITRYKLCQRVRDIHLIKIVDIKILNSLESLWDSRIFRDANNTVESNTTIFCVYQLSPLLVLFRTRNIDTFIVLITEDNKRHRTERESGKNFFRVRGWGENRHITKERQNARSGSVYTEYWLTSDYTLTQWNIAQTTAHNITIEEKLKEADSQMKIYITTR